MKVANRMVLAVAVLALAAAPAAAVADGSPQSAEKQCRQERTAMGKALFDQTYGTNHDRRNAFGRCVSHRSRQNHADQTTSQRNAATQCRTERQSGPAAFKAKYGGSHNGRNAFGKCVSTHARAQDHGGSKS